MPLRAYRPQGGRRRAALCYHPLEVITMRQNYHDWEPIRAEYITTLISQRALAAKHGVNASVLAHRAKREDWMGLRLEWRAAGKEAAKTSVGPRRPPRACPLNPHKEDDKSDMEHGLPGSVCSKIQEAEAAGGIALVDSLRKTASNIALAAELIIGEKMPPDTKTLRDLTATIKDLAAMARSLYDPPASAAPEAANNQKHRGELRITFEGMETLAE